MMNGLLKTAATAMFPLVLVGAAAFSAKAAEIKHPRGVVELFTSQGCYSCPPADKLLGQLAADDDVLALAWHVDYWDYLGWKDSFAKASHSERQYSYARSLGERQVYTPQAVVNGKAHAVGSKEKSVRNLIAALSTGDHGMSVKIDAKIDDDGLSISVPGISKPREATLYMVYFDRKQTVDHRIESPGNRAQWPAVHSGSQFCSSSHCSPMFAFL